MITSVIIDDELNSRETLRNLLVAFCPGTEVVAMAASVDEGIAVIKAHQPNLVFLDVEMPFKNGFDLLTSLTDIKFDVVFTTAYTHYAMKAIKFSAVDYLLKPIDVAELREVLLKIERKKAKEESTVKHFDILVENLKASSFQQQRLVLRTMEGFEVVETQHVIRCEGDRNYTRFFFTDKSSVLVSKTMKEYEEMLSDGHFMRVHQSHLININHVRKYMKGRGGSVEMSDGSIVDISREKKDAFIKKFKF